MDGRIRIYCAGKVGKHDWRHALVRCLRDADLGTPILCEHFVYTGPYFVSCDHGCTHGPGTHGVGASKCMGDPIPPRWLVPSLCFEWLRQADLLFAWIDDPTCFGTLTEIGWAQILQKPVYIGFATYRLASEMWFAAGGPRTLSDIHPSAKVALQHALLYGSLQRR